MKDSSEVNNGLFYRYNICYLCDGHCECKDKTCCLKDCKYTLDKNHAINIAEISNRLKSKKDYFGYSLEFSKLFDFDYQSICNGVKEIYYKERENKLK